MTDEKTKADRATLALLDDEAKQLLEALVLNVLRRATNAKAPAEMTDSERADALRPYEPLLGQYRRILREGMRRAAVLGETAVLEEMDRLGVERSIVDSAVERRRS